MDTLDESLIKEYMNLYNKIISFKERYKKIEYEFWQQSFMGSSAYDDNGFIIKITPFDIQVNKLLDLVDSVNQLISITQFKLNYFNRYLNDLNKQARRYLNLKYKLNGDIKYDEKLELNTLNECLQIEEASQWRFNYLVDEAYDITQDVENNFSTILGMIR